MALDKESKTAGKKQYHIHLKPGDIGKICAFLPGDPARSDRVAKYLDNAEFVAVNREHRTFTGFYKGVKVSVTSTGMGCPSAAIAAEELMNIGAECLIRIGSSAALQEDIKIGGSDDLHGFHAKTRGPAGSMCRTVSRQFLILT
mgnify:CR=1 FL=1